MDCSPVPYSKTTSKNFWQDRLRSTAGEKFETIAKYELGERPEREPGDDTAEVAMSGDDPHVEDFDPTEIPF